DRASPSPPRPPTALAWPRAAGTLGMDPGAADAPKPTHTTLRELSRPKSQYPTLLLSRLPRQSPSMLYLHSASAYMPIRAHQKPLQASASTRPLQVERHLSPHTAV